MELLATLIVLFVPSAAQFVVRILNLVEHRFPVGRGRADSASRTPKGAKAVDDNGSKPTPKGPAPQIVPKVRHLTKDDAEHLLGEVIQVRRLNVVTSQPSANEGRIKIHQSIPGG